MPGPSVTDMSDVTPPPPPEPGAETLGSSTGADPALEKHPDDWVTGDDPMTESQKSYLDTLARQAGEEIRADLTKAEASEQIDRLRAKTGQSEQTGQSE